MKAKGSGTKYTSRFKCRKCKSERWFPDGIKAPPPCPCGGRWELKV